METAKYRTLAKKLQFHNYFRIEYSVFSLIGIDLSAMMPKLVLRRPWITFSTISTACLLIIAMSSYNLNYLDDLDIVCNGLTFIVQSVLATWKVMIIVYKRSELVKLLQLIYHEQLKATETDTATIAKENKVHWRFSSAYCTVTMSTGVLACITPIVASIFLYLTEGEFAYLTPLPANYVVDIKKPFNFLIIYLGNLWGILLILCSTVGVDSLYSWCVHNIAAHFKVLQQKFEALSSKDHIDNANDSYLKQSITACIDYHQRALTLAELLANTFKPIILLEFMLNSAELCVIFYQIGRGVDIPTMVFLLGCASTVTLQLFLYSYGGQQLQDESEKCGFVCYEHVQWNLCSVRERKMMLLTILRAQDPCKITAGFFDVDMTTFLWVMRTALSYVTLLWSLQP